MSKIILDSGLAKDTTINVKDVQQMTRYFKSITVLHRFWREIDLILAGSLKMFRNDVQIHFTCRSISHYLSSMTHNLRVNYAKDTSRNRGIFSHWKNIFTKVWNLFLASHKYIGHGEMLHVNMSWTPLVVKRFHNLGERKLFSRLSISWHGMPGRKLKNSTFLKHSDLPNTHPISICRIQKSLVRAKVGIPLWVCPAQASHPSQPTQSQVCCHMFFQSLMMIMMIRIKTLIYSDLLWPTLIYSDSRVVIE